MLLPESAIRGTWGRLPIDRRAAEHPHEIEPHDDETKQQFI
jgi:hypothetical protein